MVSVSGDSLEGSVGEEGQAEVDHLVYAKSLQKKDFVRQEVKDLVEQRRSASSSYQRHSLAFDHLIF